MPPPPIKADDLFGSWSRGQWKSIYLLTGQEDFLIEEAVAKLAAHVLKDQDASLNCDRLDGDQQSVGNILQVCQTAPFLGGARLVIVRNTHKIPPKDQELLAESLAEIPPTTHLVLVWDREWRQRDDAGRPLMEAAAAHGQVVIFWPLYPDAAQRWVVNRAKFYKKTLAPDAAAWLVQEAGEGLRLLDQELQKTACFVGERPELRVEDVQAAFGYEAASSPYEWLARVRQRRGKEALVLLKRLLGEDAEPIRLLAMLSGATRDWLAAKNSGDSPQALAARFRLRRGDESQFLRDLAGYSDEDLMNGLTACVEADQSIKTGKETPEMALTLLTLRFCRF